MHSATKRLRTKAGSEPAPLEIFSTDPEVNRIQGLMRGLAHFNKKGLTLRHLKVMLAVEYLIRVTKGKAYPNASMLGQAVGLKPVKFRQELADLVEARYLHEELPKYGGQGKTDDEIMTYKLGSLGGTMMRQMMPRQASL